MAAARYRKLDESVKKRITRKLDDAAVDPKRLLSRLASVGAHKLRVGDYRVIIDVDWDDKLLIVLTLGHRSRSFADRRATA